VVDKVALGQVSSGTSVSTVNYDSTNCSVLIICGTVGQLVADVPNELRLTPTQEIKRENGIPGIASRFACKRNTSSRARVTYLFIVTKQA
jgi:hypothetical protein